MTWMQLKASMKFLGDGDVILEGIVESALVHVWSDSSKNIMDAITCECMQKQGQERGLNLYASY